MRRDLSRLLDPTFDLLVVGAGIHGACIAWDACLRGLSVAIIDRADFGAATSANSLGIVHGGLRYLARGDFPRMRESIRERSNLLRIAPGLVEPLPVLIPTYRGILQSRGALGSALLLNDWVSIGRNKGVRPDRTIPRGRLVSRQECLRMFPWFSPHGLTGGALWYDARLRHPERLTLSFVSSAAERGAVAANYVRANQLLVRNGRAQGAAVTDLDGGSKFEIKSRTVVVAAGPWTPALIAGTLRQGNPAPGSPRALAVNVLINRSLAEVALGCRASTGAVEDPVCGGHRYLFATPQDGRTLLGTWYAIEDPSRNTLPEQGVRTLVRELNQACPGLELAASEVAGFHWGWLPLKGSRERGRPTALAERPVMVDYRTWQIGHLLSVEGVKYTTARRVAEQVVDWVFRDMGRTAPRCRTGEVLLEGAADEAPLQLQGPTVTTEIRRAVHQEMALKLSDIVFRRSSHAVSGRLDRMRLEEVAQVAGAELGWNSLRQQAEIEDVMRHSSAVLRAEEPVG